MGNYRRYQPYRKQYTSGFNRWSIVSWVVVVIVLIILVRNGLFGKSGKQSDDTNTSGISLMNSNGNVNASLPSVEGTALTTKDCTKAISLGSLGKPYVSLTLDAGGTVGDAQAVLDVLKEKRAVATFFATGKWTEQNTAIVKAFHDSGFDVFNHSYSHDSYTGLAKETIATDLEKAETAIKDVTDESTKPYFRPPFNDLNSTVITEARRNGYCAILSTVDALDWKDGATVDGSKENILKGIKDGAIILMQVNSDIAKDLVGPLVDGIREKGYTLIPLRDLLKQPGTATNSN